MLLSRVAERVYWQARYLERAENTARLLGVFSALLMDLPPGTRLGWQSLIQITGNGEQFDLRYRQTSRSNVMQFLLAERNGASILDMLAAARENARTTREIMPSEAFELINELYYHALEQTEHGVSRGGSHEFLDDLVTDCQQIWGLLAGTMSRDAAYSFVRMGRGLERADMTTRIVDVGSRKLLPDLDSADSGSLEPYQSLLWMQVLLSSSAYQMYRQHVRHRVKAGEVVRFLLQDEEFPRATSHNLTTLAKVLLKLPNHSRVKWQVNKARKLVREADIEQLLRRGLFQHLDNVQVEIARIHFRIADTWFLAAR